MNELPGHEGKGHYLKVNLARPDTKISGQTHDGPGKCDILLVCATDGLTNGCVLLSVWATEEWLQTHAKPLDESGGKGVEAALPPGREQTDVTME